MHSEAEGRFRNPLGHCKMNLGTDSIYYLIPHSPTATPPNLIYRDILSFPELVFALRQYMNFLVLMSILKSYLHNYKFLILLVCDVITVYTYLLEFKVYFMVNIFNFLEYLERCIQFSRVQTLVFTD